MPEARQIIVGVCAVIGIGLVLAAAFAVGISALRRPQPTGQDNQDGNEAE